VLDPLRLELVNFPETLEAPCTAPVHPHHPDRGLRHFPLTRELWIEREDFQAQPQKGFFRLFPGNKVRLKYGYVVECVGADTDAAGQVQTVHARLIPDTKSGTPGSDSVKAKGVITWVGASDGVRAQVRLYDRLFTVPQPDTGERDFLQEINPDSLKTASAWVEPSLAQARANDHFQFERHGYFVADRIEHSAPGLVFNRTTGLKDTWAK
jgi:glutaminyl-tRNA synthetase